MVPVDAQTRRHVILGDAQRVGPTLQFAARVHAFPNAFSDLEADLLRFAIEIVGTMTVKIATLRQIIRIAAVARWTNAGAILTDRSGAAFHVAAPIYTLASHAAIIERTGHRLAAGAGRRVGAGAYLNLLATYERVAEEALFAAAVIATNGVDAHCVTTASVSVALVDI